MNWSEDTVKAQKNIAQEFHRGSICAQNEAGRRPSVEGGNIAGLR
jgi:hypothetical protein